MSQMLRYDIGIIFTKFDVGQPSQRGKALQKIFGRHLFIPMHNNYRARSSKVGQFRLSLKSKPPYCL